MSFEVSEYTADSDALGTLSLLEAILIFGMEKKVVFYQASKSELYGKVIETPQKETTPFYPRSLYGCAKLYSYWIVINYRESYSMYACNGILFNHESPRRGKTFVTRKITRAAARIKLGLQNKFYFLLGDPAKAKSNLGWTPKMSFEELVKVMVEADLKENEGELYLKNAGFKVKNWFE